MSDSQIHPTAIVDARAEIGAGTIIGPYCIVHAGVVLGPDCWLQHHVTLSGPMTAGARNKFYAYCSVGQQTQDLKYQGEASETVIGERNKIREFVTIHRGTAGGGMLTRIGDDCLIMAQAHVAHDCLIGNSVIMANAATLAVHVVIEDRANIGAFCADRW